MNQHVVNMISNRLSLRGPPRRSLEILDTVWDIVSLQKYADGLYSQQKFDSDPERRFALVIENDPAVTNSISPVQGPSSLLGPIVIDTGWFKWNDAILILRRNGCDVVVF